MHPFMASELGSAFDLNKALRLGLLPLVWDSSEPEKTLRGYAGLYLNEEVKMEGLVRRVGDFARFLEVMAFSHGAPLNTSNVSRECGVKRKTVESHVAILEDLLLGFRLPVFNHRAKRALVSHEKFYYFDAGVYRSLRRQGPEDKPEEAEGAALEGLVAQHLRAWADYSENDARLHYWRTPSGVEVDFVLHGPDVFCALEVKNTGRERDEDLRSLVAFKEEHPEAQVCLLYRGKSRLLRRGVRIIPVEDFLSHLFPNKPVPFMLEGYP
jgi:predicted AAA+ superfamily ATPase